MIVLQRQPTGSMSCGQHCVAMAVSRPVEEVINKFGHKNSTRTKEVSSVLRQYGYTTPEKLERIKSGYIPPFCILKILWEKKGSHWVLYKDGVIYCPAFGTTTINEYPKIGRLSSYLIITE